MAIVLDNPSRQLHDLQACPIARKVELPYALRSSAFDVHHLRVTRLCSGSELRTLAANIQRALRWSARNIVFFSVCGYTVELTA